MSRTFWLIKWSHIFDRITVQIFLANQLYRYFWRLGNVYIFMPLTVPICILPHMPTILPTASQVMWIQTIAAEKLQWHLYKIDEWLEKWRIKPNVGKSAQITFTLQREECPTIKEEANRYSVKYKEGLHKHTHTLAKDVVNVNDTMTRLKRWPILQLDQRH